MLKISRKKLIARGDSLDSRTTVILHPEVAIVSDTNFTMVVQTKVELMNKLPDENPQILSFHDEFPGLGFIVRDGPSFDFFNLTRVA